MKQSRILMGMPVSIEIVDKNFNNGIFEQVFDYFKYVDEKFSPFKETSELAGINSGKIKQENWSHEMKTVFELSEKTRLQTNGYFDIKANSGKINPSGLVKGWAIYNAAKIIKKYGCQNFFVEAGGDIQVFGKGSGGEFWKVGIQNPFKLDEIIKTVCLKNNEGIATSGTYLRGQHIYNPKNRNQKITEIVSLTVIGPDIFEADRFATAAFAMGRKGIYFIEKMSGLEGYMVDFNGTATMTKNFEKYVKKSTGLS